MRRLGTIAAFVLLLTVPVWAQHGGGHGGGGHAGGSGGHGGFGAGHAGGPSFGGMHSGVGASRGFSHSPSFNHSPRISQRGFGNRGYSRAFRHDGFRGDRRRRGATRLRIYGLNNYCYGYACRGGYYYPWAYGAFDPYWWWDSGSSYDD